jgi:site-specific DNA-methyltransferase (adenine-specific)
MSVWDLRLGDCLGPEGLASLPDRSVDHVICDPPYEVEAHSQQRRVIRGSSVSRRVVTEPLDFPPINEADRAEAAKQIVRVVRRWIVVFCQAEAVAAWRDALVRAGATYKRACVWIKPDGQPQLTGDRPGMGYESIVTAHAPGASRWNGGGKHGVYQFSRGNGSVGNCHPTQKPVALMEALVRDFTDAGELILDPFAGSGTTGVASIRLGRRFIGWERDPDYHAVAQRRLGAAKEQLELFGAARAPRVEQFVLGGSK